MPITRIAIGTPGEVSHPDALKAALAEFFSTLIFVFAGEGSGMAFSKISHLSLDFTSILCCFSSKRGFFCDFGWNPCLGIWIERTVGWLCLADKLTNDGSTTPAGLVAASLAHGFALFVAVSVGANISGGHVNPAVTFGAFMGGNISLLRGILYWIAQLLGSTVACLLLKFSTGGLVRKGDFIFNYVLLWPLGVKNWFELSELWWVHSTWSSLGRGMEWVWPRTTKVDPSYLTLQWSESETELSSLITVFFGQYGRTIVKIGSKYEIICLAWNRMF